MPTTITVATTASLIATTIWLTRLENLVPRTSTAITSNAMMMAGRSTTPSDADDSEVGSSNGPPDSSVCR